MSYEFSREAFSAVLPELAVQHADQWVELGCEGNLSPDYARMQQYATLGILIVYTVRLEGVLVGNCTMYLQHSTHTREMQATEDTLYLAPEHRRPRLVKRFVEYMEADLLQKGVRRVTIKVRLTNKAARVFQAFGYKPRALELTKELE